MQLTASMGSHTWGACTVKKGEEVHTNQFPGMTFLPHGKSK